jgi:hypothetical protein
MPRRFLFGTFIVALAAGSPAVSRPDMSLSIWFGGVSNPDNNTQLTFKYAIDLDVANEFEFGDVFVGYDFTIGGEVERDNKWRVHGDVGNLELYAEHHNWGLLAFTTNDRCDGSRWVSGSIIASSVTGTIGDTSSFYGTDSHSAFRCAGGDGSNNHFEYSNEIGDVEFTLYYDPWRRYGNDFAFGPDENLDAAQFELEARTDIGPVKLEAAVNDFKDYRIEASTDFDDSNFYLFGSYEVSELDETKGVLVLEYAPSNLGYLKAVTLGYETSKYEFGDPEDNHIVMLSFANKKWEADIGLDKNSDFAMEAFYQQSPELEYGASFARHGDTGDKSYEIGMGISF